MPNELAPQQAITPRQAIKLWLLQNNRQQQWLATRVKVSQPTLSRILRGLEASPDVAKRLARVTGIDISADRAA